jgi:hypothetical protein
MDGTEVGMTNHSMLITDVGQSRLDTKKLRKRQIKRIQHAFLAGLSSLSQFWFSSPSCLEVSPKKLCRLN